MVHTYARVMPGISGISALFIRCTGRFVEWVCQLVYDTLKYHTLKYHTLKYDYPKYYYLSSDTDCMPDFVNRTEELARLRDLYDSDDAELAVIFGRRLGKTALLKESLTESDDAVVYQAKQKTSVLQLQQFIG
jgi:hypothetical protein